MHVQAVAPFSGADVALIISAALGRTVATSDIRQVGLRLIASAETPADLDRAVLGSKLSTVADVMDLEAERFAAARGHEYCPGPHRLPPSPLDDGDALVTPELRELVGEADVAPRSSVQAVRSWVS